MNKLSNKSLYKLASCHQDLRILCERVNQLYEITILIGYRDKKSQNKLYKQGRSKLLYPNSKHNKIPSLAVDIAPYPIDWCDTGRFYFLAGIMFECAKSMNIGIRWGGDWDGDKNFKDQSFNDLVHYELKN